MGKKIQMTKDMFAKIVLYFLLDETDEREEICKYLEDKVNRLVMHDLYSRYKTDPSAEKRKEAINEYLNKRGVPESFRY